jgi:hypothetical protein
MCILIVNILKTCSLLSYGSLFQPVNIVTTNERNCISSKVTHANELKYPHLITTDINEKPSVDECVEKTYILLCFVGRDET